MTITDKLQAQVKSADMVYKALTAFIAQGAYHTFQTEEMQQQAIEVGGLDLLWRPKS